jgi:hypothetical protein
MWATALTIGALAALLATLGYIAFAARRLEAKLEVLTQEQGAARDRLERELDRVRATAVPGC